MDQAKAALLGAAIGALSVLGATFVTNWFQFSRERRAWLRTQQDQAYCKAIEQVIKVADERHKIVEEGRAAFTTVELTSLRLTLNIFRLYFSEFMNRLDFYRKLEKYTNVLTGDDSNAITDTRFELVNYLEEVAAAAFRIKLLKRTDTWWSRWF